MAGCVMKAWHDLQRCRAVRCRECGGFLQQNTSVQFSVSGFLLLCVGENSKEVYAE